MRANLNKSKCTNMCVIARGAAPYDQSRTVYVQRKEPSGTSTLFKTTDLFATKTELVSNVEDFLWGDKFLFATKRVVIIVLIHLETHLRC